jgi:hypothetical protein
MRDNWLSNRVFSPSRWPWAAQTHTADSRFVGTADLLAARRFQRGDDIILHAEGPLCTDLTGFPANGGFYFQAFNGSVVLPVAGHDYNSDWTPHWRDFHPLEGQLASLHWRVQKGGRDCNIEPPASPCAIMRRDHPYRKENSGPGKDFRGA